MKLALAVVCAAGLGIVSANAQQSQTPQTSRPDVEQGQQQEKRDSGQEKPRQLQNVVSVAGCVYQASDQPTVFAIRRMEQDGHTKESAGAESSANGSTSASSGAKPNPGATSSDTRGSNHQASAAEPNAEGAWYRLTASASEDLKRYVGQRVRINGQLTPGRDPKGNDVVIHRITPEKTVVTTIDLQPAPQLSISSISPLEGSCQDSE